MAIQACADSRGREAVWITARQPTRLQVHFAVGRVRAQQQADGQIAFLPAGCDGGPLFWMPKPFMTDARDGLGRLWQVWEAVERQVTQTVA